MGAAKWTEDELQYLKSEWGESTPNEIAEEIGRSLEAVIIKSKRLNLGPFITNSEFININQASAAIGIDYNVIKNKWIKRHKLPVTKKQISGKRAYNVINVEKLMKWLKNNQDKWDSRNMEPYALGTEPQWLKDKRKADRENKIKPTGTKYTPKEDAVLVRMMKGNCTYGEIGQELGRTYTSVKARAARLDVWGTGKLKEDYTK